MTIILTLAKDMNHQYDSFIVGIGKNDKKNRKIATENSKNLTSATTYLLRSLLNFALFRQSSALLFPIYQQPLQNGKNVCD